MNVKKRLAHWTLRTCKFVQRFMIFPLSNCNTKSKRTKHSRIRNFLRIGAKILKHILRASGMGSENSIFSPTKRIQVRNNVAMRENQIEVFRKI